jgi:hypothetical protein
MHPDKRSREVAFESGKPRSDFDLGSEILSSYLIHSRKVLQEEHWNESRIMEYILNDTPRTDDDSILNGLNDTIAQDGGCGRTTRELNTLLHSTT